MNIFQTPTSYKSLLSLLAVSLLITTAAVQAQTILTWKLTNGTSDWNSNGSWTPSGNFPNSNTETAIFDGTAIGTVDLSNSVTINQLQFSATSNGHLLNTANASTLTLSALAAITAANMSGINTIGFGLFLGNAGGGSISQAGEGSLEITSSISTVTPGAAVGFTGAGKVNLSGSSSYTGITTISSGTLEISGVGALTQTLGININGGTLLFSGAAANRINNAATVSLGGATQSTLRLGASVTESLGALSLSSGAGTRVIDFGSAGGALTFASISNVSASSPLQIWNWSGTVGSGGGTDKLINNSVLNSASLAGITFFSGSGTGSLGTAAYATGAGNSSELVPVPEPTTLFSVVALLGPLAWHKRRSFLRYR